MFRTRMFMLIFFLSCSSLAEEDRLPVPHADFEATKAKARAAYEFSRSRKFSKEFCILIDMGLHSGVKRFFVWDFKKDTIVHSFLVSHGCCDNLWSRDLSRDNPSFSNEDGSHCSSLGKYKIGRRAYSDWGVNVKYVLHGLEATNSNALRRWIVFHSWDAIPDDTVYPEGVPEGWGCPTVSNSSFRIIDPLLKASGHPVLMWIYK